MIYLLNKGSNVRFGHINNGLNRKRGLAAPKNRHGIKTAILFAGDCTSHLLDFTIKLNEILNQESKNDQTTEVSESIGNYLMI